MNRGAPRVELQTTIGSFVIELYTDHAPKTCKNFVELTRKGYYDGTPFHRVIRVKTTHSLRRLYFALHHTFHAVLIKQAHSFFVIHAPTIKEVHCKWNVLTCSVRRLQD